MGPFLQFRIIYHDKFNALRFSGNFSLLFWKDHAEENDANVALGQLRCIKLGVDAQAATPKDVLVVAQIAEPKSMDPATVTAVNNFRILMSL